jgi:AAA+ ATPase superfamily predicted ATPase
MKFISRQREIANLNRIRQRSYDRGQMTIVTGRRRIGKTRLIKESLSGETYLYFFVARLDEPLLCDGYVRQIEQTYGQRPIGSITRFIDVFRYVIELAKQQQVNLVIDEFQEFLRINPSVYSEMQNHWDSNRENMMMNLILSGSVYSLMHKIFQDYNEPLFGRATGRMHIQPFKLSTLRNILRQYAPDHTAQDLLTLYTLTGGVPKYVEIFVDAKALTTDKMLALFLDPEAIFLEEGKDVLIQEFGKEYTTYFSILTLVAAGKTSRAEVESVIQRDVGGYFKQLEEDYLILQRRRPLFSKVGTRNVKYYINDEFLHFWFRFIFKNTGMIELENFGQLRRLIDRDFTTYTGLVLEKMIRQQLAETQQFSAIGQYWQRNGENEIDVIALNDLDHTAIVGEVKLQAGKVDLGKLRRKAEAIEKHLSDYTVDYRGFSLDDVLDADPLE